MHLSTSVIGNKEIHIIVIPLITQELTTALENSQQKVCVSETMSYVEILTSWQRATVSRINIQWCGWKAEYVGCKSSLSLYLQGCSLALTFWLTSETQNTGFISM